MRVFLIVLAGLFLPLLILELHPLLLLFLLLLLILTALFASGRHP